MHNPQYNVYLTVLFFGLCRFRLIAYKLSAVTEQSEGSVKTNIVAFLVICFISYNQHLLVEVNILPQI